MRADRLARGRHGRAAPCWAASCCWPRCRCTSSWSRRGGPLVARRPWRSSSAWRSCSSGGARRRARLARRAALAARASAGSPGLPSPQRAPHCLEELIERRARRAPQPPPLRQGHVAAAGRARDAPARSPAARPGRGPSLADLRRVIAAIERGEGGREDRRRRRAGPRGGRDARPDRGGQGRRARADPGRHPRQRPRAHRGLPGPGQDARSRGSWPRRSTWASAASSSRPTCCPSDITGSFLYDQRESRFEFRAGPVFTNLLLADEINRATPKTQAALLEAMQEAQVTDRGPVVPARAQPFVVIATQNPIELEGTYPLPEAQLDRFLLRVGVGYPDADAEREILKRRRERRTDAATVPTIVTRAELLAMQDALEDVFVSEALERYIVALTQATRSDPRVTLGASPRGSLALLKLARAEAAIRGRDFVLPDDVKAVAVAALAHRLVLRPELWVSQHDAARTWSRACSGRCRRRPESPRDLAADRAERLLPDRGRLGALPGRVHRPRRARGGRDPRRSSPSWPAGAPGRRPPARIRRELSSRRLLEDERVTVTVTLRADGAAAPGGAARAAAAAGRASSAGATTRSSRCGPVRRSRWTFELRGVGRQHLRLERAARARMGTARARRRRGPASRGRDGGGLPAACARSGTCRTRGARRRSWATTCRPRRAKASSPATSGPSRPAIRSGT